jgi:hypothetical protein
MRGTRIEKEVEICATNLANKTYFLVISRLISLVSSD